MARRTRKSRRGRRSRPGILTLLLPLTPGVMGAVRDSGGFQNIGSDPAKFLAGLSAHFTGYNPQTSKFDFMFAVKRTYVPAVLTSIGLKVLNKVVLKGRGLRIAGYKLL